MLQTKNLLTIDKVVSLTMMFFIGFWFGTVYPETSFIVVAVPIFMGACIKIWLHHQSQKLQKADEQQ
jgi:hypothetical protein